MRAMLIALGAALLSAAASPCLADLPPPPAAPGGPLAHHGFPTTRDAAERAIQFHAFLPDPNPVAVALESPFHGEQLSRDEGIAYAYTHHDRTWVFSEWPEHGGNVNAFAALSLPGVPAGCGAVRSIGVATNPHGIVWATPRGFVYTLKPDGFAPPKTIFTEFRRLIRRGVCR